MSLHLVYYRPSPALAVAVATNPHVTLIIHCDSVRRNRPVISCPWPAPVPNEVASLIKLENRRCCSAAITYNWILLRVCLLQIEGTLAMDNPDMVLGIDRHADGHSENPMVWQGLRPHWVHFKPWGLDTGGMYGRPLPEHDGRNTYGDD